MSDDLIFNHKNEYQKKGTTMIPFNEKINPFINICNYYSFMLK